MKRVISLLLVLLLAVAMTACEKKPETSSATVTEPAQVTEPAETEPAEPEGLTLPDGYTEADDLTVSDAFGYVIRAPKQASESLRGISADGKTLLIFFMFEDTAYTFTVSSELSESTGAYDETEDAQWVGFPYTLNWSNDGSGKAEWRSEQYALMYRLTCESGTDHDKLAEISVILLPEA